MTATKTAGQTFSRGEMIRTPDGRTATVNRMHHQGDKHPRVECTNGTSWIAANCQPAIPQPTPASEHARCHHGLNDIIGYVVRITGIDGASGQNRDVAYIEGRYRYNQALTLVRELREQIFRNEINAIYAVIDQVHEGGHRLA